MRKILWRFGRILLIMTLILCILIKFENGIGKAEPSDIESDIEIERQIEKLEKRELKKRISKERREKLKKLRQERLNELRAKRKAKGENEGVKASHVKVKKEGVKEELGNNLIIYGLGGLALVGYITLQVVGGGGIRNPKMNRSYWGGRKEEEEAKKRAKKQIKNPKRNSVSLYIGANIHNIYEKCQLLYQNTYLKYLTNFSEEYKEKTLFLKGVISILKKSQERGYRELVERRRLYIPDVQRGTAVCGAPGSGKTFSIIDPALRSAVDQGHPIILYDFKYPDQASLLVPYALLNGYTVKIFAPGFDESDVCNPISFLHHVLDAETARQISVVMNKNFNLGDSKGDKFFDSSADQLMEAAFMLIKCFREADILTVQAFLSLSNLIPRLKRWAERKPEQDLAIILGISQRFMILMTLQSQENILNHFNFDLEFKDGQVKSFNLLRELIMFLYEYYFEPDFWEKFIKKQHKQEEFKEQLNKLIISKNPNANDYILEKVDSQMKDIKYLENKLPNELDLKDYGRVDRSFGVRLALEHLIKKFKEIYNNPEPIMDILGIAINNFSLENFLNHISIYIDAITYFLNVHPDYNPASESMRTKNLKSWIRGGFSQLISTEKSERTLASIISVTNNNLIRFVKPNIARHFVGETTLPLYLESKQLLVFGLDRERRDTVGPLMATILHLIVNFNLTFRKNGERRKYPLVVALDELPTMYLPALTNWLNENRSDGFCGQIGFQNMNQLERSYGKEVARSILTGCNTKFIFNPGEPESAEFFSRMLGEEELKTKQRSRSSGKGGGSTSISDQEKSRKLFEPAQFLKLPQGKCIFMSPGYGNKEETSVPIIKEIWVPPLEVELAETLKPLWTEFVKQRIQQTGGDAKQDDRLHLNRRQNFLEYLFAISKPKEKEKSSQE